MNLELDLIPARKWWGDGHHPFFIAGPCSAETEEQVITTAKAIAETTSVQLLRAGVWKPRTRPDSFEGVGEQGLVWLKEAGRQSGLPVATEVAKAKHVEACLRHGIDAVWIGARTTVNPFLVQEIADALKGVDIPVLVKNPIHPDLQLWIGALERINRSGIKRLAAIHRGFFTTEKNGFRNAPVWEIPIELKTLCPELDIICDPSHIAGSRDLLGPVAQKALDLDMAGLMIEAHPDPDHALSDPAQQITPATLADLFDGLAVRRSSSQSPEFRSQLEMLRNIIDEIDEMLVQRLAERMKIVDKIAEYKLENNVTILQLERWREIIETRTDWGEQNELEEEFILQLLKIIHRVSISRQTDVMNRGAVNATSEHDRG